jgi:hypothetical protein
MRTSSIRPLSIEGFVRYMPATKQSQVETHSMAENELRLMG